MNLLRALGIRRWDWRTCWRTYDFWRFVAVWFVPFGFLLLVLEWQPIRARVRPRR